MPKTFNYLTIYKLSIEHTSHHVFEIMIKNLNYNSLIFDHSVAQLYLTHLYTQIRPAESIQVVC